MPSCSFRPVTELCASHGEPACLGISLKVQTNNLSIKVLHLRRLKLDLTRVSISFVISNYSFFCFCLICLSGKEASLEMWILRVFVQVLTPASDSRRWRCGCVDCQCWWRPRFQFRSTVGQDVGENCFWFFVTAACLPITQTKTVGHFLLTNPSRLWRRVSKPGRYIFYFDSFDGLNHTFYRGSYQINNSLYITHHK